MLMFIKLDVLIQISKILAFLASYEASLFAFNSTDFYNNTNRYESEEWIVDLTVGKYTVENFRRVCINAFTTPFFVDPSFNLTELFLKTDATTAWLDLYKSKTSHMLLSRFTNYPPILNTTVGNEINAQDVYQPHNAPPDIHILDTYFYLEANYISTPGDPIVQYRFRYKPIYNTSSIVETVIGSLGDFVKLPARHSVWCMTKTTFPRTPKGRAQIEAVHKRLLTTLSVEMNEYRALAKEWKAKINNLPLAENSSYQVDKNLDVDNLCRSGIHLARTSRAEILQTLVSISDPIDLQILMFDHQSFLKELSNIRQQILDPLTDPLKLIDAEYAPLAATADPVLLRTPDLNGYYLQLENRLRYIVPAVNESRINRFQRAGPFYSITLMDWIGLGFSILLTAGMGIQCMLVSRNTLKRWKAERLELRRLRTQDRYNQDREDKYRPRVNKVINETVMATRCEGCDERSKAFYKTRAGNKPKLTRARQNPRYLASHELSSNLSLDRI
jgi:hypothetical protein